MIVNIMLGEQGVEEAGFNYNSGAVYVHPGQVVRIRLNPYIGVNIE